MSDLIPTIFLASTCSIVLVLFFIFARHVIARSIGAIWHYYLWFTVYFPWILIFVPDTLFSKNRIKIGLTKLSDPLSHALHNTTSSSHIPANILMYIWLIGIFISLSYLIFNHLFFSMKIQRYSRSLNVEEKILILKAVNDNELVPFRHTYLSTMISSPMISHLFYPKMYLPIHFFTNYTATEQKHVLKHEFTHYQRGDLIANAFLLLLACINWFNPIFLLSYRYFRNAQELACDAKITQSFSAKEKKDYGYSLIKTAITQSTQPSTITCWWNSSNQLKERCQMLKLHSRATSKTIYGAILFLVTACVALAAPALQKVSDANTLRGAVISAYKVHKDKWGRETYLVGNVEVVFNNQAKLNADRMLIKYRPNSPAKIAECVIYGRGVFTSGNHVTEFKDGTYNPKKMKLTASYMRTIQ